ncbi:hypothetical protein ACNJX9_16880 [Bradyrhizobium sp. DASA03076]|uniref:hypothetical protein n=1 Tax=Bradyrhizobium sp. BLXBL-03 TaxID=3395916 RepID=UPI003F71A48C
MGSAGERGEASDDHHRRQDTHVRHPTSPVIALIRVPEHEFRKSQKLFLLYPMPVTRERSARKTVGLQMTRQMVHTMKTTGADKQKAGGKPAFVGS